MQFHDTPTTEKTDTADEYYGITSQKTNLFARLLSDETSDETEARHLTRHGSTARTKRTPKENVATDDEQGVARRMPREDR